MFTTKTVEITVGIFVMAGIAAMFMLAMKVSNLSSFTEQEGYELTANFENVGGLKKLSPVNAGGVRVGRVKKIEYDQEYYQAKVTMMINDKYNRFPEDSSASILTSGLLGEQYIGLEPGGDEVYLADGGHIELTQSAIVMEQIIGQFLFNQAAEKKSE